jgi:NADPH2:quinone reductase
MANINPRDLMVREASCIGVMAGSMKPAEKIEAFDFICEGLQNGTLIPVVGAQFALADAPAAHVDVIEHRDGTAGKIVLQPWVFKKTCYF